MATFYLLPPRECLEQAAREFVERYLPGVEMPELWTRWSECLQSGDDEIYLVHREDLQSPGDDAELVDLFGAEAGDLIHEVALPVGPAVAKVRSHILPESVCESRSAH